MVEIVDEICHGAAQIGVEDGGVNVAFAANGGRVAEARGYGGDGVNDVLLELGLGVAGLELAEGEAGEDGAGPGAEVLGGEVLVGDLAKIVVDVGGADGVGRAVVVEIFEEFVSGSVVAGLDDACEATVGEVDGMLDAGFSLEVEGELGAVDIDVAAAHGGEAVGVVVASVLGVADADEGGFEQADDGGKNFLARKAVHREVVLDTLANGRQGGTEVQHVLVFGLIASGAPAGVVAALLASASVAAGGLQMPVGGGTDPDVDPCGWDGERFDAGDDLFVADGVAVGSDVAEAAAGALARDAGTIVIDVAKACGLGGLCRIGQGCDRLRLL